MRLAELARGEAAGQPDARIEGDRMAVHELIETGTATEDLTITGDQGAVRAVTGRRTDPL